ncbi:MAG: peptidase dimerization domain-containing protein [Streptosporangiales bacterium]|nr:peptidase dimerization domain-containing protein [Streptosporangiales bacterium]
MTDKVAEVLSRIDSQREELADMVLRFANTYGPVGHEAATAREIDAWYKENGMESRFVSIVDDRANVVGYVRGSGGGKSLLFNAHLDTEASGPDYDNLMQVPDPNVTGGWREGDLIFGHTALNDRHAHALFMVAARAIQQVGIPLQGDLVLTSVAGETGQAPVDEYQGLAYEGKGFGSTYLVDHGVRADYALVSETSDFTPCWYHCGANYYKVTLRGRNMYTPRLVRTDNLRDSPNAIAKAAAVIIAIEEWGAEYTRSRTTMTPCGEVRPNAQVGAVRGGIPWRPNRSSPYCALYVDVRTRPGDDIGEVTTSLKQAVDAVGVDAELELVMSKTGAEGKGTEPLADAITLAHKAIRGVEPPKHAEPAVVSMWRDSNVFNKAGIPSINFGPSRGRAAVQGTGFLALDDLVDATKMYALISLRIAGGMSSQELRIG